MDSKNFIWLSSFFSLLFITFCVTSHLDELNPYITSMPREVQEISTELDNVHLDDDIQDIFAPKVETPKVETPKVETPKVETPKVETPKVETPKVETPKAKVHFKAIKQSLKKEKSKKINKPKIIITKSDRIKKKMTIAKSYTIEKINLDSVEIEAIMRHQNNNELNKLAYLHQINKASTIHIFTHNKTEAILLTKYLQKKNVQKNHIEITIHQKANNLIKLTLTGRK